MKKRIALLAATGILLSVPSLSFGAVIGEVDFENFSNSLIYVNSGSGPVLMSGTAGQMNPFQAGSYIFALFAAETKTTTIDATLGGGRSLDNGGWDWTGAYGVNTATPGLMNGNDNTDPGTWIGGWGEGEAANFAVVGWSANIGDNLGEALAWWNNGNPAASGTSGYFGISDIAQDVVVGGGPYPVPTIFGPTAGYEVQGFTLNYYSVPEPSTWAMLVGGFGALLAFRRRR